MKKQIFTLALILFTNFVTFSQETYKIGNTEYYYGQTYQTTGKPFVKRSESNKSAFLKTLDLSETPEGYEIDHIKPLSEGGTDDPSNMQLLTVEQHQRKTAEERADRSNSTYSYPKSYTKTSTYNNLNNNPNSTSTSTYSRTDSNGKTIYKGSRGGEYYINGSGNKVYVNSESSTKTSTQSSSTTNYNTPSSSSNRTIQTGSRGGQYYINSNGNKSYVKKKN
ncbi:MAG: hypothetical protein APF83_11260 [Lutibacter sp. BRH_c52]|nr:MAG: hypothetical protein APF83_11260 [Lutibacter sp. BRH_c52]